MKSNCIKCNKEIVYGLFADEYSEITQSGLCSNTIDGCYEKIGTCKYCNAFCKEWKEENKISEKPGMRTANCNGYDDSKKPYINEIFSYMNGFK